MALRFTRRTLLSLATALMAAPAHAQTGDAVTFVRDFYTQEIARHAAKKYASEAEFLSVFTADAQKVWHAAQANRNKANVPLGPILHVFLGQGALPGREIKLGAVTPSSGDAVSVALTIQGNPRQLVVRTVREGGTWKFADIDYGSGESFIAYHRRRAGL
jgi:hypothetical protein